jgi:hypothetical protein
MNSKIVSLENKRVTLKKIVEESYPNFSIEIPKYYTRIEKIIKLRNSFAHHQVDITPIGIKLAKTTKNIIMIDSSKDVIQYNTDEIEKSIADIVEIRNNLTKMNMKNI